MTKITNKVRGFIDIRVTCPHPERFINLCAQAGVAFWGVRREDHTEISATIYRSSLGKATELCERMGARIIIIRTQGAPFFLSRFRHRYMLMVGFIACVFALLVSNQYIWEFSVEGNEILTNEAILKGLENAGITIGTPAAKVDVSTLRNQMLVTLPELSWITVNVSGSRASVVVRERVPKPYIIPRSVPANIVAEKSGVIIRIDTLEGNAKAFTGQTVHEGQLLVSGLVDSQTLGVRLLHARADVYARTWYDLEAVIPLEAVGKAYTGRVKTRNAIIFAGKRINLYDDTSQPFAWCDKMVETRVLQIPPDVVFPVMLVTETYSEYTPVNYHLSGEVGEGLLARALEKSLEDQMAGGELEEQSIGFEEAEGLLKANLHAQCVEQIARSVEIEMD